MSFKLSDPGERPDFAWLPVDSLLIDHNYQRDIDAAHAQRILKNFSWNYFQSVTVTPNGDTTYNVIDGQHRVAAARLHPLVNEVPCTIIKNLSVEEQAKIFARMNDNVKPVTQLEVYWAALGANEPEYLAVAALMERVGVRVLDYQTTSIKLPPNSTCAVGAIKNLIKKHGEEPIEKTLTAMKLAWPDQPSVFIGPMITACTRVLVSRSISVEALAKTLSRTNLSVLIGDAHDTALEEKVSFVIGLQEEITGRLIRVVKSA